MPRLPGRGQSYELGKAGQGRGSLLFGHHWPDGEGVGGAPSWAISQGLPSPSTAQRHVKPSQRTSLSRCSRFTEPRPQRRESRWPRSRTGDSERQRFGFTVENAPCRTFSSASSKCGRQRVKLKERALGSLHALKNQTKPNFPTIPDCPLLARKPWCPRTSQELPSPTARQEAPKRGGGDAGPCSVLPMPGDSASSSAEVVPVLLPGFSMPQQGGLAGWSGLREGEPWRAKCIHLRLEWPHPSWTATIRGTTHKAGVPGLGFGGEAD